MRVIAGRLRGATIATPATSAVRPTYDRVRESLFSIIEPRVIGASVLDLFAGSGSLGIESLSRGAASATFVELDARVLKVVQENISRLDLAKQSRTVRGDGVALLRKPLPGSPFDVIFVDPPYATDLSLAALDALSVGGHLADGALVVVEHGADRPLPETVGDLTVFRRKRYGTTAIDFYEARGRDSGREEQT